MSVTGITDPMLQYNKSTEAIYMRRPKNGKAHGVKRPDTSNIVVLLTAVFVVLVAISSLR